MATKKSPLDLLIAIGKSGPKSSNPEGVMGDSTTAPDQAEGSETMGEPAMEGMDDSSSEPMPNSLMLPKGFKLPDGVEDGAEFTTTIRAKKMGDHLMVSAVGDMPMDGSEESETSEDEQAESPEEQAQEAESGTEMQPDEAKMAMAYKKKKADSDMARNVFKS